MNSGRRKPSAADFKNMIEEKGATQPMVYEAAPDDFETTQQPSAAPVSETKEEEPNTRLSDARLSDAQSNARLVEPSPSTRNLARSFSQPVNLSKASYDESSRQTGPRPSALQVDSNRSDSSFARYRAKNTHNRQPHMPRPKKTYFDIHEADDFDKFQPAPGSSCSRDCFGDHHANHSPPPSKAQEVRSPPRNLLADDELLEHARRRERMRQAANEEQFLERAVQRAKEREKRLSAERRAKGVYIEGIDPKISAPKKAPSPTRDTRERRRTHHSSGELSYTPYTLQNYRELPKVKNMGGLGPHIHSKEHEEKVALRNKARELARKTAMEHKAKLPIKNRPIHVKVKAMTKRERAAAFAKNVPKPKNTRRSSMPESAPPRVKSLVSPQVQGLLARHDQQRQVIEKMRMELGL
jgi:hypothetical protein